RDYKVTGVQTCALPICRMRYVDMQTYLADCLMPKVDVASMANSLEVRAPLLDQEIVRFAMSLPDEWLLGPDGGKRILREVLYRRSEERRVGEGCEARWV